MNSHISSEINNKLTRYCVEALFSEAHFRTAVCMSEALTA